MGLLAKLRAKKELETAAPETEIKPKTKLRLYLENLISKMGELEMGSVKLPGVPFEINLQKILPTIAKQLSDEMIEGLADFLLIIAKDIQKIRESEKPLLIEVEGENSSVAIETDEIIADSTELPKE